jgi:hypothetical protein
VITACTNEVLSPANDIRNLLEFSELVDKGRERWRWILDEAQLGVDRELYHQVYVNSLVKGFCWEYSETLSCTLFS